MFDSTPVNFSQQAMKAEQKADVFLMARDMQMQASGKDQQKSNAASQISCS